MKTSRRELSIDMVVGRNIFKNNQIALFLCFNFMFETDMGLPVKQGFVFTVLTNC